MGLKHAIETSFKPGQSGNPKGRPKDTEEVKAVKVAKKTTQLLYEQTVDKYFSHSKEELEAIVKNENGAGDGLSSLDRAIAAIVYRTILTGDHTRLESLLGRRIGSVTSKVEVTGRDGGPIENKHTVAALTKEELEAESAALAARRSQLLTGPGTSTPTS